ncbi:MAG: lytic transglycosylase domain-containing protein [Acidobacteriota bacterium]|nr:lytic transglycosylase domain-containing protein [Acidobacteriota bacterium]
MRLHSFRHQLIVLSLFLTVAGAALALPLVSASCRAPQVRQGDAGSLERLRAMTRRDMLPAESIVAQIESAQAGTTTGALARLVRARVKLAANDFAGAAALLDDKSLRQQTALADYALLLRADALAHAGRRVEARAAYEQLAREFPASLRARDAILRGAELTLQDNQAAAVPLLVKKLIDADDGAALLLAAKAYAQQGDTTRARAAYRRLYFYAPATDEAAATRLALTNSNAGVVPANPGEAVTRADELYAARRYAEAATAYADAFNAFPGAFTPEANLRRGIAALNAKRPAEAAAALSAVPASAGEVRAQALYHLAQAQARSGLWVQARTTFEEMRRQFPDHTLTKRTGNAVGQIAKEIKNATEASNFFRAAVTAYPGAVEIAGAQFELAWAAHESRNFNESSRLLLEHLAVYADRNTDNRGRAGYWAARDFERAGKLAEARALYQAMLQRYDANWYGYLSQQRLDALQRTPIPAIGFAPDSPISRAIANLNTVSVAEEIVGAEADERLAKVDQLNVVGLDEWALEEVNETLKSAPASPRLNLAKARVHRSRDENLQAFLALQKSYPDYAQMKPEELTAAEWDVFYPLSHWEVIKQEGRARGIDPYRVAGLIRQESVFSPRASSSAKAYGLMQLLLETARNTARKHGIDAAITSPETLFEPRLNIRLGTAYLKDQLDRFGRIEYVAAAYNAGPGRAVRWRTELPAEIDEWAEAVPFKETRGYVQGVVRNTMQYRRLYDEQGQFRPNVGTRSVRPAAKPNTSAPASPTPDAGIRPRRVISNEEDED